MSQLRTKLRGVPPPVPPICIDFNVNVATEVDIWYYTHSYLLTVTFIYIAAIRGRKRQFTTKSPWSWGLCVALKTMLRTSYRHDRDAVVCVSLSKGKMCVPFQAKQNQQHIFNQVTNCHYDSVTDTHAHMMMYTRKYTRT